MRITRDLAVGAASAAGPAGAREANEGWYDAAFVALFDGRGGAGKLAAVAGTRHVRL